MKKLLSMVTCILLIITTLVVSSLPTMAESSISDKKDATTRLELFTPLSNDFLSRTATVYKNINGKDVTVYGFYREAYEQGNNPNFSQALLIYQCIKYKDKYPEKPVSITVQSFHFSIVFSACVDVSKPDYGHVKNLYNEDYNSDGYYRLSYLLVEAAKKGIEVYAIGQLDGSSTLQEQGYKPDKSFVEYFTTHLDDDAYISGKKVSDYMTFGNCQWTSYGDKAAADMMHNKICTVSNYIDNDGNEHGPAVWTGSINIDGIDYLERNGNDSIQTAVIVTEHEQLRNVMYNYAKLMSEYCSQEGIVPFRVEVIRRTTEQVQMILDSKQNQIPSDEQIVYLGTEYDQVFELYFTPFGGDFYTWDTRYNPYCKYLSQMLRASTGEEHIEFIWNNAKFKQNFDFADIIVDVIRKSFENNNNVNSILHLRLPGINESCFNNLISGQNIGYKSINNPALPYHTKDLQLSYVFNNERKYVTILNSLNFHEGSSYHQTNTVLIIKESNDIGNNFYVEYATLTVPYLNLLPNRV